MNIKDYLIDELKRLNRMNDLLEKNINKGTGTHIAENEIIKNNALTMCEIVKALK